MTWQSEDDFIKDLTSLSDFSSTEVARKFLMIYGKEEPKPIDDDGPATFLDTSSGEPNVVTDDYISFLDFCPRYAGRGKVLRSYLKSKLQLKDQIRLARPLGSSDIVIEAYFNRFGPKRNKAKAEANAEVNAKTSEVSAKPPEVSAFASTSTSGSNPKTPKPRIKATRNSKLQSNALIDNLLKKISEKENQESIKNEKKNHENSDEIKKENASSTSSSSNLPDENAQVANSDTKKAEDLPMTFEKMRKLQIDKIEKDYIDDINRLQMSVQLQRKKHMEILAKKEAEKKQAKVNDSRKLSEPLTSLKEPERFPESYSVKKENYTTVRRNRRRRN